MAGSNLVNKDAKIINPRTVLRNKLATLLYTTIKWRN